MDRTQFTAELEQAGFAPGIELVKPADGFLDLHTHSFEAKALILAGEIRLTVGTAEHTYLPGQIFHLAAHQAHSEVYGPHGVTYLVGRKEST